MIGWLFAVASTAVPFAYGMRGFAEPHESFLGLLAWSCVLASFLHFGLLWVLFRPLNAGRLPRLVAQGFLLLPASILSVVLAFGALSRSNFLGFAAVAPFLIVYVWAWLRMLRSHRTLSRFSSAT